MASPNCCSSSSHQQLSFVRQLVEAIESLRIWYFFSVARPQQVGHNHKSPIAFKTLLHTYHKQTFVNAQKLIVEYYFSTGRQSIWDRFYCRICLNVSLSLLLLLTLTLSLANLFSSFFSEIFIVYVYSHMSTRAPYVVSNLVIIWLYGVMNDLGTTCTCNVTLDG